MSINAIAAAVVYNGWRTDQATEKQTRTLLLAQESARTGKSIAMLENEQFIREWHAAPQPRRAARQSDPSQEPSISGWAALAILLISILGAAAIGSVSQ